MPVIEKSSYDPVADGQYLLSVVDCTEKTGNNGPFHIWKYRILNQGELEGREFTCALPEKMTANSPLEKMSKACGIPELAIGEAFNSNDLIGAEFYAHVAVKARKDKQGFINQLDSCQSVEEYETQAKALLNQRSRTTTGAAATASREEGAEAEESAARPASTGPKVISRPATAAAKKLSFPK